MKLYRVKKNCDVDQLHAELEAAGVVVLTIRSGSVVGIIHPQKNIAVVVVEKGSKDSVVRAVINAHVSPNLSVQLTEAQFNASFPKMERGSEFIPFKDDGHDLIKL